MIPVVRCRIAIVEGANGPHLPQARQVEQAGEHEVLAPHAPLEVAAEVPFVNTVLAPLDRLHAVFEFDHRRDRGKSLHLWKLLGAQFAGQFHRDIATQRIARHGESRQAVAVAQLPQDEERIGREPRVIEPARQVLGTAAIALIEADDVEAGGQGLVGHAAHVVREARAFQPVQHQQRRRRGSIGLPIAVGQHAGIGRDVEVPRLGGGQRRKPSPARPRIQGHLVPAGKAGKGGVRGDDYDSNLLAPALSERSGDGAAGTRIEGNRRIIAADR